MSKILKQDGKFTNGQEILITDRLYLKQSIHGNTIEFKTTIKEHLYDEKFKNIYQNNKIYIDTFQYIYIFLAMAFNESLFDYLKEFDKDHDIITITYNYSKLISKNENLKDELIEFFNEVFDDDAFKYNDVI